ncbi:MAG: effector-associated domain EAD1-containing protein [Candidatus Promineifilaceae bacterium]
MSYSPSIIEQLCTVLTKSFTRSELRRLLRFKLNENIGDLIADGSNWIETVEQVVNHFERRKKLCALVRTTANDRPHVQAFGSLVETICNGSDATQQLSVPSQEASPEVPKQAPSKPVEPHRPIEANQLAPPVEFGSLRIELFATSNGDLLQVNNIGGDVLHEVTLCFPAQTAFDSNATQFMFQTLQPTKSKQQPVTGVQNNGGELPFELMYQTAYNQEQVRLEGYLLLS